MSHYTTHITASSSLSDGQFTVVSRYIKGVHCQLHNLRVRVYKEEQASGDLLTKQLPLHCFFHRHVCNACNVLGIKICAIFDLLAL